MNPIIVAITMFDILLASVSALAGFLVGQAMRTDLRNQRIGRGIMCLVLAPLALGLIEWLGHLGWGDEALSAALTTVPLLLVAGTSLVAGLFLLLCGPRKVVS